MRYSESDLPRTEDAADTEERLRRENEELRRQLQQLRASSARARPVCPPNFGIPPA